MSKVWATLLVTLSLACAAVTVRTDPPVAIHETLRVATFNIHKGASRRGPYDLERTIDAMARLGADVIGVQEAMRNDAAFGCDDQPALIATGLRRRTGRLWAHVYAPAWVTDNRRCADAGRGDDVATEGLAVFASDRIIDSQRVRLNTGRVGLAVRLAGLPDVPVVVTHLAANRRNQADRVREIGILLPWLRQLGPGSILIGDLNAEADARELAPLVASYRDAWVEAVAGGTARGTANGATRPNGRSRIDYVMYTPTTSLVVNAVEVVDTRALGLGDVSDHMPVVATFRRTRNAGVR
jgi:endonuclease/exonuclease/phosphatase family metal-dependent hydrolase